MKFLFFILLIAEFSVCAQTLNYEMFVSSRNTHSVKRYNGETGEYIDDFVKPGSGGLSFTQEVAFGTDGNLYVSGRGNKNILKYNGQTGEFIGEFTHGYTLQDPTKMTFAADGKLYVSQWGTVQKKVARFDAVTGAFIDEFTKINLNDGSGHAWDKSGNFYVASFTSRDVKKFDKDGNFITVFVGSSHLQGPVNLWFGTNGDLFVLDWVLGQVRQFDGSSGTFKKIFITGLANAEGFAFGSDNNIYICDWTLNRISKFDSSGVSLGVFASGGNMMAPNSIVFRNNSATSIENKFGTIPQKIKLNQNYPNPFNPATTISFTISFQENAFNTPATNTTLKIFDLLGKEVVTLINEPKPNGYYEINFDAKKLSGGVYYYQLITRGNIQTKKMILLK